VPECVLVYVHVLRVFVLVVEVFSEPGSSDSLVCVPMHTRTFWLGSLLAVPPATFVLCTRRCSFGLKVMWAGIYWTML